ncbi:MAG: lysophospholipid acyltransferase family protein [Rickettsiales bacterium]
MQQIKSYFFVITLAILSIPCYALVMLSSLFLKHNTFLNATIFWAHVFTKLLYVFCGLKVKVEGIENIPAQPSIICSRHESALETVFLYAYFKVPAVILKQEVLRLPFFGWGLARFGMISIDRSKPLESVKKIRKEVARVIKERRHLLIFPEGTRLKHDEFVPYKSGGLSTVLSADLTDVKIVPVALNTGLFWERKTFLIKPGVATIKILPPINPIGDKKALLAELKTKIDNATKLL